MTKTTHLCGAFKGDVYADQSIGYENGYDHVPYNKHCKKHGLKHAPRC